ncbi:MAG: ABC transporter permease, partial [Vicinamibacteria bacterium]
MALTLALLAGAGLMLRSFLQLYRLDLAIDTSRMTTMALRLPENRYPKPEQWTAFFRGLQERLSGIVALSSITLASAPPFAGAASRELSIEGRTLDAGERPPAVSYLTIGPRYFETLGTPLVRGRAFGEIDGTLGHEGAIVNELFASTHFAGEDPIGRRIRLTGGSSLGTEAPWLTIVGIAPTIRQNAATGPDPVVYVPSRADPQPFARLLVRSPMEISAVTALLREEVRALDQDLPLYGI